MKRYVLFGYCYKSIGLAEDFSLVPDYGKDIFAGLYWRFHGGTIAGCF